MKIGIVKEIKENESRVSVTPEGVRLLCQEGHEVLVEVMAGIGSGFSDEEYQQAGAEIVDTAKAWQVELVVKVKEPLPVEYQYLNRQMVFTFFHLAGVDPELTRVLLKNKVTAIAYETLEDELGRLPILAPMSAVAGNMATLMGSYYLASFNQGKGMQLGTVMGKKYGKVLIIGDGVVGRHAAHVALSMGAEVYLAGLSEDKGRQVMENELPGSHFVLSVPDNIACHTSDADLVVGAVLSRGAKAPYVVTREMIENMVPGSVIVDVSIDQGGCIETSRPTTHTKPTFIEFGIIHYCVTNMPGAYPRTSTIALTEATMPYLLNLARDGLDYFRINRNLAKAINVHTGYITHPKVAEASGLSRQYRSVEEVLN
jgi:alanine dehydrogenase